VLLKEMERRADTLAVGLEDEEKIKLHRDVLKEKKSQTSTSS